MPSKKLILRFLGIALVCFQFQSVWSQGAFTFKYFGMTIHPFGDVTANLQPYKLDKDARFVMNLGAFVGYERFLPNPRYSVKAIQAGFLDCSAGLAGFTHLGFRAKVIEKKKHSYHLGIGPVFFYRESWTRFGGFYPGSTFFKLYFSQNLGWIQYKILPIGVDMEYDYQLNEKNAFSVSVIPGAPMAVIVSFGWKHYFEKPVVKNTPKIIIPR